MTATAIKLREGIELPEFRVPENRIVPLVDDPSDEQLAVSVCELTTP